jgi:hypothetical protein
MLVWYATASVAADRRSSLGLALDKRQVDEGLLGYAHDIIVVVYYCHIDDRPPVVGRVGATSRPGDDRVGDVAVDGIVNLSRTQRNGGVETEGHIP